jgi:carbon-monoxide dehydrogenase small subunit
VSRTVRLNVNGAELEGAAEPRRLLSDFLRHELGLTGTHVGCEHGVCGACTIMLDGAPVRSCLLFAVQAEGASVRTVESLSRDGTLHPLQEAFRETHALQCGFCTPGFLICALAFLEERRGGEPTDDEIVDAIGGNLCRCTGYRPIVEAVRIAARSMSEERR